MHRGTLADCEVVHAIVDWVHMAVADLSIPISCIVSSARQSCCDSAHDDDGKASAQPVRTDGQRTHDLEEIGIVTVWGMCQSLTRIRPAMEKRSVAVRTGRDKVAALSEVHQLPAPLAEVSNYNTRVVLFAQHPLSELDETERLRAMSLHACLQYVNRLYLTNESVRERFRIKVQKNAQASRLIYEATTARVIMPDGPSFSTPQGMHYVPVWVKI